MKVKDVITKLQEKHCLNCNCRVEDGEGNAICGEFEKNIEHVTSCLNWEENKEKENETERC